MNNTKSLQEIYAPSSICFGCGPANPKGLHIRSFLNDQDDGLVAEFVPEKHHEAFPGVLNGGIIGALLDCHSNWTAAYNLMKKSGANEVPCTVTSEFAVKLLRPTPSDKPVKIVTKITTLLDDRAVIDAQLISGEKVCATCVGTFVAVKPGHPAYHRWG